MNFRDCYELAQDIYPREKYRTFRKRLSFAVRLFFHYRPTIKALDAFFAETPLRNFIFSQPGFKENICIQQARSSFYRTSKREERLAFLLSHTRFLENTHQEETIKGIYSRSLPPIVMQEGEHTLLFKLSYENVISREGLLLLSVEMDGTVLYKITFWLMEYIGVYTLCVGALQGGKDTLETNRLFTKEFWGLRPQNMAMMALRWYAKSLGVEQILTFPRQALWSRKISRQTALDDFWQEQGAISVAKTPFIKLDSHIPHKDISEIATRKRSMYKKRYEFLDRLEPVLTSNFKRYLK